MQGSCFHIWLLIFWRFTQIYLNKYVYNLFLVIGCPVTDMWPQFWPIRSKYLIGWELLKLIKRSMWKLNDTQDLMKIGVFFTDLKLLTFFSPSKAVGSSPVGSHSLMSWSRPLVARIGALGCGSKQFTWDNKGQDHLLDVKYWTNSSITFTKKAEA